MKLLEYEKAQLELPFEGSFRLKPPVNNQAMCTELIVKEQVPNWLEGHSSQHIHGETHVHFDSYLWTTPKHKALNDGPGYVYFIENTHDSLIKIGKSRNPEHRLATLQTSSGFELKLVAKEFVTKMSESEQYLHDLFDKDRVKGEWFFQSSELLDYIGGL